MKKYITLGEYNKLYKYLWFFILFRLIYSYIFTFSSIPKSIKFFTPYSFPKNTFSNDFFEYLIMVIFSLILLLIENKRKNKNRIVINITNDNININNLIVEDRSIHDSIPISFFLTTILL